MIIWTLAIRVFMSNKYIDDYKDHAQILYGQRSSILTIAVNTDLDIVVTSSVEGIELTICV